MIMPRISAVRRGVVIMGILVVCGWVWLTAPIDAPIPSNVMPGLHRMIRQSNDVVEQDTRKNTPEVSQVKDPVKTEVGKTDEHSHHHSNLTLEELRKNMTLLRANMSGVESIMMKFNKSQGSHDSRQFGAYSYEDSMKYPNPHPFKYMIHTESVCKGDDVFLITYVHTAPSHYKRRMIIRETWGNPKYYDTKIRVVFIMGNSTDKPEVQNALLFEAEQYNDIVQENFQDTYKNLTYKGIGALKWVSKFCNKATFVLKTDDDIFVNMFTLLKHLSSLNRLGVDNKNIILCLVWYKMKVMREGKWRVDEDQWKDPYYPTYCSGSAYTMSMDAAIMMHNVSYHVPFFWVDDFYITGLLPLKLNGKVKHKQFMSTYVLDGTKLEQKFTGPQWFTYIFSHVHDLNAIQSVWSRLVRLANGEVVAPVQYALPGQLPKEDKLPNKG